MHKSRLFGTLRPLFAACHSSSGCGGGSGGGGRRSRLVTTTATAAAFGSRSSSLITTSSRPRQYNSHEFHSCLSSTILFSRHPSSSLSVSKRQRNRRQLSYLKSHNSAVGIIQNDDETTAAATQQWLMYSLPEGYCVGVALLQQQQPSLSSEEQPSSSEEEHKDSEEHTDSGEQQQQQQQQQQQEQSLPHRELLHPEEYTWGQTNMISSNSRTSYYLGRIALRLALKRLLLLDDDDDDGLQPQQKKQQQKLNQKLWEEIITNPIQKDSFGRPILPELVVGSISHKGNYAVGLAAFHPDECERVEGICDREEDDDDDYYNKIIRWREDCPIYYNDDGSIITSSSSTSSSGSNSSSDNNNNDGSSNNNINQGRIGIGIDLERIDDTRGDRIQRKVLTKNEQNELGGLVDSCGISIGEEVTLRFSLKESVYKAMHPILCEYVGFQEAEITPLPNGSAKVTLNLQSGSHERLGLVIRSISWRRLDDGFFLTTALVVCGGEVVSR